MYVYTYTSSPLRNLFTDSQPSDLRNLPRLKLSRKTFVGRLLKSFISPRKTKCKTISYNVHFSYLSLRYKYTPPNLK